MRKTLFKSLLVAILLMLPVIAMTQTSRVVTGTVRDGGGFTMPGVNVFIQGTTIGTVTDIAGNFSLEVQQPESAILVFSFIGFDTKEVLVGTQTAINLVMTEYLIGLDEVVAVGYGTAPERFNGFNCFG